MVEAVVQGPHAKQFLKSQAALQSMSNYLEQLEFIQLQKLDKNFYDSVIPRIMTKVSQPSATLVLESKRTNIELGFWKRDTRGLNTRRLLKIGDGTNGTVSSTELGFSELYFQYVIQTGPRTFYAWPMENEAMLKIGYKLEFDTNYNFLSSTPVPELAAQTMRPTAVLWNKKGEKQIMMLGGQKDRWSQNLSLKTHTWHKAPAVPAGHNITTNISVNWQDKAIFTFIIDAQLTIKSAVMDLHKLTGEDDTSDMNWALILKQSSHGVDRLHVKCGVTLADGRIAVLARGKPANCLQQISGVILYFQPVLSEDGTYKLKYLKDQIQRHFPSIFPRQLDHLQVIGDKLLMVQDTPDEEKFEVFSIDMKLKRETQQYHQRHFRGIFEKLE